MASHKICKFFSFLFFIIQISCFNSLIWAIEEGFKEENKILIASPDTSSFETDIPEEIQKYVLY